MVQILVAGSSLANSRMDSMEPSAVEGKEEDIEDPLHSSLMKSVEFLTYGWTIQCSSHLQLWQSHSGM